MKRILTLISISFALGISGWGVGGCGSGVQTTTDDGFPLLGAEYRVQSVDDECQSVFSTGNSLDIVQDSSSLSVTIFDNQTITLLFEFSGTTDKDANIEFHGNTADDTVVECSGTAILEGSDKEDITLPLDCMIGATPCSVTYSDHL